MTKQPINSILFKSSLVLTDRGYGLLDDLLTISRRNEDTREQFVRRVSATFGLRGARLTRFISYNIKLPA